MNKLKAIFFLTILLFSITGNSFVFNFCNGSLKSTTFLVESSCCCSPAAESAKKECHIQPQKELVEMDCCASLTLDIRINEVTSNSFFKLIKIFKGLDTFKFVVNEVQLIPSQNQFVKVRGIPIRNIDIFLQNQVFII